MNDNEKIRVSTTAKLHRKLSQIGEETGHKPEALLYEAGWRLVKALEQQPDLLTGMPKKLPRVTGRTTRERLASCMDARLQRIRRLREKWEMKLRDAVTDFERAQAMRELQKLDNSEKEIVSEQRRAA